MNLNAPVALLSPAEALFDRRRRTVGLFAGPGAFALLWMLPIAGLSTEAHRLAAVLGLVVVWWTTEALPFGVTALIGSALVVVCGVAGPQQAFAPYASPIVFLFVGTFMLGRAVSQHGLDRRLALALLGWRRTRSSPVRVRLVIGALAMGLSAWMSNAATSAMLLPLVASLMTAIVATQGTAAARYVAGFLLTIAYGAGIGGMLTPVGSPPNLITIGLLDRISGVDITFPQWMLLMAPIAAAQAAVMFLAGAWQFPAPRVAGLEEMAGDAWTRRSGTWTAGQRNCAIAFGAAVVLWMAPGVVAITAAADSPLHELFDERLHEGVVAVLAAGLLFVLPTNWSERRFTLEWREAGQIDWGTILLFGGGLSLGQLMFTTGLAERLGTSLLVLTGGSIWTTTAMAILAGMVLTEFTSNTACTNMLVPVVLTMSAAAGINPVPPALGALVGVSASYMLPISAPHNAIMYGTGMLPATAMLKFGLIMKPAAFLIGFAGLRALCPLLGLA